MKCKYLISWVEYLSGSEFDQGTTIHKVGNFTDEELEEFINDKLNVKVQFICVVPDVPLNRRHVM